jgi:hypothetical protein
LSKFSLRRLLWAGPLAAGLGIAANLLYYAMTRALGEPYVMPLNGSGSVTGPMPVSMVVVTTLVGAIGALLLFALLVKITKVPLPPFLSISVTALLVSFGGPFGLPTVTLGMRLLLSGMHILAALIIVGGILYFSRER